MAINWIKTIKIVGTICSGVSLVCGAVSGSYEVKEAAKKAVEEALKNQN